MGPTGPQTHSATTAFVLAPIVLPLPILTSRSAVRLLVRSSRAPGRLEREYQDRSSEGAPLGNLEALEKAVWREVYERDLSQSRSRHGSGQHGRHDGIDTNTHSSGSAATVGEESQVRNKYAYFMHGQNHTSGNWPSCQRRRQQQPTSRSRMRRSWKP